MARWLWLVLVAVIAVTGLSFSLLNPEQVTLKVGLGQLSLPLGILVLLAVMVGAVSAGLLLWAGVILPLRFRLRSLQRASSGLGER